MEWISSKKYLPGDGNWKIVRCINKDLTVFYFMALYVEGWSFFDDDKKYEENMRVTHWCCADKVNEKEDNFEDY